MARPIVSRLLALMAGTLVLFGPGRAGASQASDQGCLMCHSLGSPDRSRVGVGPGFVDAKQLSSSAHDGVGCAACHQGVSSPHSAKIPAVRCVRCHAAQGDSLAASVHGGDPAMTEAACRTCHGTHGIARAPHADRGMCAKCHAQVAGDYEQSIHGRALVNGDPEASTCKDCHGPVHAIRSHLDPSSSTSHDQVAATCARCHSDRRLVERRKITIPEAVQLFRDSVHGRSKNAHAAVCNDCHESHRLRRATDPASSIYRGNIPATCGRCHPQESAAYLTGVHGTALRAGVIKSPTCTDCHGEHLIRRPSDLESPVAAGHVTETCARCHEAQGIRETFGLPAGRLSTYRDSFHGLAARGGSPAVANCASCHGYHDILPSKDPRSAVSPRRLAETCGKCHPGAGPRFALGLVHVATATKAEPVLYWTRYAYLLLIAGTIGFMLFHNGLDFFRKIARTWGAHMGRVRGHAGATGRWFERMTVGERVQHGLLAVSFFTLVYTGFALKFPEAWLFAWFARLERGYQLRSLVHRGAAIVMTAVAVYHVLYLFTRRGRQLVADLFPRLEDAGELGAAVLHLLGLRPSPPPLGRFSYIEKAEYWALIWGTVVMTATGVLLWFEREALSIFPKWVLDLSTLVHYYEAWLAFLAILVWHVYQNVFNPDVYPMNWTWLSGRIPEEQMKHEHYREWERLTSPAPEPPAEDPGGAPR